MNHYRLSANPVVTVQDYVDYFVCSERTALRYRLSDRLNLGLSCSSPIRLSHWMQLNAQAPPQLEKYVTVEANW